VERALKGEEQAFDKIMRRYNQRLFRLACSVLGEPSEAEDVLQESYVRAFGALSSFSGNGSFGAWLARIVRNEAIDRLRARNSLRSHIALEADLDLEQNQSPLEDHPIPTDDTRFNPAAATEAAEMKGVLESAIAKLPDPFRGVFMLREVEGLSIEETADYLGIPAATVRTRDHRARLLLRRHLGESIDRSIPHTFEFLGKRCDDLVARVLRELRR
jgi:RNA polymerase sigma-70 factor, ECF subfamily